MYIPRGSGYHIIKDLDLEDHVFNGLGDLILKKIRYLDFLGYLDA